MSEIRWCDEGSHPFSANDTGRQQFTNTLLASNGVREVFDICGVCVETRSQRQFRAFGALSAQVDGHDTHSE